MTAYDVKQRLRDDAKYWPLYLKWYEANATDVEALLKPLVELDELRSLLDEHAKSGAKALTSTEIVERDHGAEPLFKLLVADIDPNAGDADRLGRLLENFIAVGPDHFDYTMGSTDKTKFLAGTKGGDCNTLVRTFVYLATEYLGIKVKHVTSASEGFTARFITPANKTIDGKTGNVDKRRLLALREPLLGRGSRRKVRRALRQARDRHIGLDQDRARHRSSVRVRQDQRLVEPGAIIDPRSVPDH